jgi:hypothetical protein
MSCMFLQTRSTHYSSLTTSSIMMLQLLEPHQNFGTSEYVPGCSYRINLPSGALSGKRYLFLFLFTSKLMFPDHIIKNETFTVADERDSLPGTGTVLPGVGLQ